MKKGGWGEGGREGREGGVDSSRGVGRADETTDSHYAKFTGLFYL